MNSNDIKDSINEGRQPGDPTGVVHQLGRIWFIGLLVIIILGALFFWRFTGRDAGNDGINQPTTNMQQPPS